MKKLKEKSNQTNGITLVALIITIIVLIILAGVTISIALGENGIFKKSKKAVDEYQKSAKEEEEELDTFYDNLESLDPNSLAAHVKLGDYVDYNPREGVEDENLTVTIEKGNYNGNYNTEDYQNWDILLDEDGNPNENLLKSGTMGSGKEESQTFTVPTDEELEKIKWRVLSIEDGCVNLVSEKEIGRNGQWKGTNADELYLENITGYAYGPQILDEICNLYGQGTGAKKGRSITVEDVNKISGYNEPSRKEYSWKIEESDKTFTWRNSDYTYKYDKEGLKTTDQNSIPYILIFKGDIETTFKGYAEYWLASRMVRANTYYTDFVLRRVGEGKVECSDDLFGYVDDGDLNIWDYSFPVRPVVTLKSTAKFNADGGTGTAEDPIKFIIEEEQ